MKSLKIAAVAVLVSGLLGSQAWAADFSPQSIIKEALLGAGTGALSSELSGGKAGKGALIGAGTNVIGGALFSALFDSPAASSASYAPSYSYSAPQTYIQPQPVQTYYQPVYRTVRQDPVYTYSQPASYSYAPQPQTDSNRTIIRQGLLGAGVGAFSAGASGGKAGTGALIGAGTNIIGGALLDTLLAPQQRPAPSPSALHKKIVRHYDASGKVVSEEEYYV
jgi:hypothetical protein